jgi:pimeloyl-ACP methyl ester carboxylesterase
MSSEPGLSGDSGAGEPAARGEWTEWGGSGPPLHFAHATARIFQVSTPFVWRQLRRIRCPMLFVRGARSDTFKPNAASRAGHRLPGARVVEIPAAGHLVPMERPEEVTRVIFEFVDEVS